MRPLASVSISSSMVPSLDQVKFPGVFLPECIEKCTL